ncbi:MAG TPA: hypothetical protein VGN34_34600, partial [Ktedonobacteraceae bacterium]
MMQQTFPVEGIRRIVITDVKGDVRVQPWDQPMIQVESSEHISRLEPEGDVLILSGSEDSLQLLVPDRIGLAVSSVKGDVRITGIQDVSLTGIHGDISLITIADQISLDDISGDVQVKGCRGSVSANDIGGDAAFEAISGEASLSDIAGDVTIKDVSSVKGRRELRGGVTISQAVTVDLTRVDGDLVVKNCSELMVQNVGGDLRAQDGIAIVRAINVG